MQYLIGIGARARQGKDTVATYIKEIKENAHVKILHWADALYNEVRNKERKSPLVIQSIFSPPGKERAEIYYSLLNKSDTKEYLLFHHTEVPYLHQIMNGRGLCEYWGMDEKDAPMLQFWGTNFRRNIDTNWWVNSLDEDIEYLKAKYKAKNDSKDLYIVIADTRFKNEYDYVINNGGVFLRVERMNDDGTQFIDESRDRNHPSEIELDDVPADYVIKEYTGAFNSLKIRTSMFLDHLKLEFK